MSQLVLGQWTPMTLGLGALRKCIPLPHGEAFYVSAEAEDVKLPPLKLGSIVRVAIRAEEYEFETAGMFAVPKEFPRSKEATREFLACRTGIRLVVEGRKDRLIELCSGEYQAAFKIHHVVYTETDLFGVVRLHVQVVCLGGRP